jgi:phosphoglycerate kinase
VAIVAGSKVSTKLDRARVAGSRKVDQLIVGGGIANTFLAAAGRRRSASRCTRPTCSTSRARSLEQAQARGAEIPLPADVVVAPEFAADGAGARCERGRRGRAPTN